MRARGATLRANAELRAASHADGVWTLTLADGATLRARAIINAAGAWADHVAALCAASPVGLQPCRRTAFTFNGPPDVDFSAWPAVVGVDESYYFKPDAVSCSARRPTRIRSRRTTWRRRNWTWPPASTASRKPPR